ncbi:CDP-alcohol phosphatidyltransferase family protein [Flavimaricola marinus]|uniref:Inner membrane protein YnjF n=1 Tax=Flavimaricola marinus TaxID=1819565 RepID=A0A238LAA0_9RHOB|nr:CDP-alcohol phosphatidyltransferase family protein [Flavimaricola marinus]SMY06531.1 Inner membrane protein YnjF [Flavimaricola marinus]
MLDAPARRLIDPTLNRMGAAIARFGVSANTVTMLGLGLGLLAALLIVIGWPQLSLLPLLASRLADGLDGAIARATQKTDFGGYLDIAADFLFYGAIPLAFVLNDPAANGAAGAFLLASFYFNGTSFLGYAILAEKRGMKTSAQGVKSLYYSNGILEGTETIGFFILLCLFSGSFPLMAWVFGTLCFLGGALRIYAASRIFRD